jgi:hypothetical protein
MRRRDILILLGAVLMTSLRAASAKIWRIGFITALNGPGEDPKSQRRAVTERGGAAILVAALRSFCRWNQPQPLDTHAANQAHCTGTGGFHEQPARSVHCQEVTRQSGQARRARAA